MRKFSIILALFAMMLLPFTAMAQDSKKSGNKGKKVSSEKAAPKEEAKPAQADNTFSVEQILLNNHAYDATAARDFEKAELLFKALLALGEFNIVWVNLGRTYISEGKCIEARDALNHAATAPKLADLPVDVVNEKAKEYMDILDQMCSSKVVMNCNPSDMSISIDGGREMKCKSSPISLVPGQHSFFGRTDYGFNTAGVTSVEGQTTTVDIEVINFEQVVIDAGVSVESLQKRSKLFKGIGYSFIGVGAGLLGGGIGLAVYYYNDYKEAYNKNQQEQDLLDSDRLREIKKKNEKYMAGGYAMSAIGGAMLVAGISLVVVDAVKIQPQIEKLDSHKTSYFDISPVFSPEFNGLTLSGTF